MRVLALLLCLLATPALACGASWYNMPGHKTASGQMFNGSQYTAAHRTIGFGRTVEVVNIKTGRSVTVTVNDRGPFARGRCIDLTKKAFLSIASLTSGVIQVRLK